MNALSCYSFAISRYSKQSWWLMATIFTVDSACCLNKSVRVKHLSWLVRLPSPLWPWRTTNSRDSIWDPETSVDFWPNDCMCHSSLWVLEKPLMQPWFSTQLGWEAWQWGTEILLTVPFRTFSFTLLWIQISSGKIKCLSQTWFPLTS